MKYSSVAGVAAGSSSCSCDFLVNGFVGPTMFTLPLCPTRRRHKSATKGFAGATLQPTKRSESESSMQSCSDLLHQRLSRSVEGGLWRKVFHELLTDRNNRYLMIYSTIVQAHTIKRPPGAKGARTGSGVLPRRSHDRDPCWPMCLVCRSTRRSRIHLAILRLYLDTVW